MIKFEPSNYHTDGFLVSDDEGEFGFIARHLVNNTWEFKETEEVYLNIEDLKEIVKFMEENCK